MVRSDDMELRLRGLTMTPKLRLSEAERKASLSATLKLCMPGNSLTIVSMQMMLAPITHAGHGQSGLRFGDRNTHQRH